MLFSPLMSATKSPMSATKSEGSLIGLDFDAFTLSEYEDIGLSATQSPHHPSQISETETSLPRSPKEPSTPLLGSNLYVASLPESCTDALLMQLFSPFGPIISAKVMCVKGTRQCKGYGFVLFAREEDAAVAQASMIGRVVDGSKIQVRRAHLAASAPLVSPSSKHTSRSRHSTARTETAARDSTTAPAPAAPALATPPHHPQTSFYPPACLPSSWLSSHVLSSTVPLTNAPPSPHVHWSCVYPQAPTSYPTMWSPMTMSTAPPPPPAPQVVYVMVPSMNPV